jgi:hypothetical protein
MGDALSPVKKSVSSTHKKNPPFAHPQKETRLGFEPTTYMGMISDPLVIFHWGAGRLSRGIGHIQLAARSLLSGCGVGRDLPLGAGFVEGVNWQAGVESMWM